MKKGFLKRMFPFKGKAAKTLGTFSSAAFLNDTGEEMFAPYLPLFATVFLHMTPEQYGLMEGIVEALNRALRAFTGTLSDRWSRKLPVALGYILISISRILLAPIHLWYWLVPARGVRQIGRAFRDPAREASIADNVEPDLRGKGFGLLNAVDTMGAIIGPFIGLLILSLISFGYLSFSVENRFSEHAFRWVFVLAAIPTFCSAMVIWKFLPDTRPGQPTGDIGQKGKNQDTHGFLAGIKKYLADPKVRNMTLSNVILAIGAVPISMMLLYVYDRFSVSATVGGILFVVYSVAHFLTSYPAGGVADRLGGRKTQLLGILFLVASFVSLILAPGPLWCAISFIFYASFDSLWLVNRRAVMSTLAPPDRRGQYLGTFSTLYGLSSFIAPVLAGIIWHRVSPHAAFITACIIAGISIFFMPSVVKR
ncbi:MAG: MFS transporter [Candidatus Eremiobacteraeota bacterium]|nr:MFS transporter [Candidatus Eremiobacteraeota bacterium]